MPVPATSMTLLRDLRADAGSPRWTEFVARYRPMMEDCLASRWPVLSAEADDLPWLAIVELDCRLAEGARDGRLWLNGELLTSSEDETFQWLWQPRKLGENVFVYKTGLHSITTKVDWITVRPTHGVGAGSIAYRAAGGTGEMAPTACTYDRDALVATNGLARPSTSPPEKQ